MTTLDQWPLTQERITAAQTLVNEQMTTQHLEPSNNPWNISFFVIIQESGDYYKIYGPLPFHGTYENILGLLTSIAIPLSFSFMVIT